MVTFLFYNVCNYSLKKCVIKTYRTNNCKKKRKKWYLTHEWWQYTKQKKKKNQHFWIFLYHFSFLVGSTYLHSEKNQYFLISYLTLTFVVMHSYPLIYQRKKNCICLYIIAEIIITVFFHFFYIRNSIII